MANENQQFVTLAEFLKLNPALSASTVRRWIRAGKLAHCQPGGPRTKLLIPTDALNRIQLSPQAEKAASDPGCPVRENISGPRPNWLG